MDQNNSKRQFKVIVIGAGQAGLSVGYYLSKYGIPFLILDENQRVGDAWRKRWDSLRLFTPSKFDNLPGMPFPAPANYFPSRNEMADYLEGYAEHFNLPVKNGFRVTQLSKEGEYFCIKSGTEHFHSEYVIVAMSNFQVPKIPEYSSKIDPGIVQLHSFDYRNPSQLIEGDVLVVGAGNSGAEVALEASRRGYQVWLSGRDTGHIPFNIEGTLSRIILARLVIRVLFHRVFTTSTPIGRKIRPKVLSSGGPLIRIKPEDFDAAGVRRVPRVTGVKDGLPVLENGQVLNVKNVVWCTGFYPSFSWIDIPAFKNKEPVHTRGVVREEPGLYFTGLHFLYSFSSAMIHGAARDAGHIVKDIRRRIAVSG